MREIKTVDFASESYKKVFIILTSTRKRMSNPKSCVDKNYLKTNKERMR